MNRWIAGVLLLSLIGLSLGTGPSIVKAAPPQINIYAETAALIDVKSGRLLHNVDGDKRMRIASLTKIMTAIVAIEQGQLSDSVEISRQAFGKEGSSLYLKLGEEMSLHHLLYGLMLRSGNDAAVAIAEHVGGSVEGFAYLMNRKAEEIGMDNSQFMNPHGLDQEGHYSTANDMAKLTAYALKNPVFQEIVKTEKKQVARPEEKWDAVWHNKNKMLHFYPGADGVKTGYTKLAKRCLVSSATQDGQQLAVVTLNDPNDWVDHKKLLDFGFAHYPIQEIIKQGETAGEGIVYGRSFSYPLTEEEKGLLTRQLAAAPVDSTEFRLGERGSLTLSLNGVNVGSVPLYAVGSPRLNDKEKPAFGFKASSRQVESSNGFMQSLLTVCKALFTFNGR